MEEKLSDCELHVLMALVWGLCQFLKGAVDATPLIRSKSNEYLTQILNECPDKQFSRKLLACGCRNLL